MDKCQRCTSSNIAFVGCKHSDMFWMSMDDGKEYSGYNPGTVNLGGEGDYTEFDLCLDCGQIQGEFPVEFPS